MSGSGARLAYRPELDGLRAIAVGLVLVFHLGLPLRDSGQTGVTVFFVLSGFLITRLLRTELASTGRIDLRRFYVRRVRRLAPALAVVLVAVAVLAILRGGDLRPVAAAGLYLTNLAKALGLYMGMLDHTWTLAVEEQFYVVWPALLAVAVRWPIALALAAPLMAIEGVFPLAVGCALGSLPMPRVGAAFAAIGAGAIFYSAMTGLSGFAVAGTVAVLAHLDGNENRVLASRPFVAIGRLSYGIYLWQYPMLWEIARAGVSLWLALPPTFAAAYLSARFVESRFRSITPREGVRGNAGDVEQVAPEDRHLGRRVRLGLELDGLAAGTRAEQ